MKIFFAALIAVIAAGCASTQPVKTQAYAKLNNQRTFEYELPVVWKGIEKTLANYKVVSRDPEDVDALEFKKLTSRSLETDWIYGQSRDKYIEYKVNGSPRRKNLQTRLKIKIVAERGLDSTHVKVTSVEEIENLRADGTPAGYDRVQSDSSRLSEMLDKIQNSLLSAAP